MSQNKIEASAVSGALKNSKTEPSGYVDKYRNLCDAIIKDEFKSSNIKNKKKDASKNNEVTSSFGFGYTQEDIQNKYPDMWNNQGLFIIVGFEKNFREGLGINLCGHKNIAIKKVFINNIIANSPASQSSLKFADQIIEINGISFVDVDYTSAAWTIKLMNAKYFIILAYRPKRSLEDRKKEMLFKEKSYIFTEIIRKRLLEESIRDFALIKRKNYLGICIDDDYDELLGWMCRIIYIEPDSPAAEVDIQIGEVILYVNEQLVLNKTREQISAILNSAVKIIHLGIIDPDVIAFYIRDQKKFDRMEKRAATVNYNIKIPKVTIKKKKSVKIIVEDGKIVKKTYVLGENKNMKVSGDSPLEIHSVVKDVLNDESFVAIKNKSMKEIPALNKIKPVVKEVPMYGGFILLNDEIEISLSNILKPVVKDVPNNDDNVLKDENVNEITLSNLLKPVVKDVPNNDDNVLKYENVNEITLSNLLKPVVKDVPNNDDNVLKDENVNEISPLAATKPVVKDVFKSEEYIKAEQRDRKLNEANKENNPTN